MKDSYLTISEPAEAIYKIKSSKFLCYAYPISSEEEIAPLLEVLYKKYYDATHHCYAWRLGFDRSRANDDGEPSSTAGKPILGQMLSREITNCLIVVVRYFGGTKLGVSGLIEAYRDSAAAVLDEAEVVEQTVDVRLKVAFSYMSMNGVMKVIKEMQPNIEQQDFDNLCTITLTIRSSKSDELIGRLESVEGATVEIYE
ncbi:MAG: YigZ family protein [Rikenellaceae bacterium]